MCEYWNWQDEDCLDAGVKENDECVEGLDRRMFNREMVDMER